MLLFGRFILFDSRKSILDFRFSIVDSPFFLSLFRWGVVWMPARMQDIAIAVKQQLEEVMKEYGYQILQALVTDMDPDRRVKEAMNEINASKRLREAATNKAEADKIMQVPFVCSFFRSACRVYCMG